MKESLLASELVDSDSDGDHVNCEGDVEDDEVWGDPEKVRRRPRRWGALDAVT